MYKITNKSHQTVTLADDVLLSPYETRVIDIELSGEIDRLEKMGIISVSEAQESSSYKSADDTLADIKNSYEEYLKLKETKSAKSSKSK